MAERISVTITAQDGASKTFTAIGNSAQKMGDQIEQAGKEGTDGLKTIDTQAKSTGKSIDDIKARATALGAAFGTLVSAAALLGSSYRNQERQIDGINRLYGDQADVILEMSENIQDFTRFSNDAARESALLGSSLATNYELSADQIGVLVERSADLAQIYGFDLPDAFARVAGAIRGEGEAAERLGLNMSDAAIAARALDAGITNWNVPGALSEAEKAAFRFQVFLEDTAATTGAAAAAADNAGGRFRQFANELQDAGQAVGGFLGPVGQVAAEMAPLVVALPIVGAGFGRFAALLTTTSGASTSAAASIGTLGLRLGGLGLALTAIGLAGYGVYKIFENIQESASGVAEGVGLLTDEIERLKLAAQPEAAAQVQAMVDAIQQQIDLLSGDMSDLVANGVVPEGTDFLQITTPGGLADQVKTAGQLMDEFSEHVIATANSITDPTARQAYLDWVNDLLSGIEHTVEGTNLDDIINQVLLTPASEVPGVMQAIEESTTGAADGINSVAGAFPNAANAAWDYIDAVNGATVSNTNLTETWESIKDAQVDFLSNGDNILDFWLRYQENIRAATQESLAWSSAHEGIAPAWAATDFVSPTEAAFEATVRLADALSDAGNELDSVLATYERIDALGQRSAASGSIAENLVGTPGEWAEIDELLKSGAITLDEYNAALDAGYRIQESNLRVQEDLNAMRAAQLPLLAEEQRAYEEQIDALAQLPPLEQRRAMALQDSAVQAQIATQYATAYSATLGEIPEDVATNMIVSAAEADPVLKDLLLQFGLIEEGADGTITVNFPDGPTVQETVTELTRSIDALIVTMGGVPPLHITADASQANATITDVQNRMATLDHTTANPNAVLVDAASAGIERIRSALAGLDNRTATTYVKTVYTTSGTGLRGDRPFRMGGVIPEYADGGVLFRGAEAGPELLHFATGGVAPIFHDSLYRAPVGTYVSPANANPNLGSGGGISIGPIVFNGGGNRDEMNRWASDEFIPLIQTEMDRWARSQGVV